MQLEWSASPGAARLVSWTTVHKAPNAAFTALVPYTVGIVALAEGPWMYGRIDGAPSAGVALRVAFVHPQEGESYPIWTVETGVQQ